VLVWTSLPRLGYVFLSSLSIMPYASPVDRRAILAEVIYQKNMNITKENRPKRILNRA
jgi:hypothetical protein